MTEKLPLLESLLQEFGPLELIELLDLAMLKLIVLLRYEVSSLKSIVECYESLYEVRKQLLTYIFESHGN